MRYTESIYFSIERGALGIEEVQYRDPLPAICKVSVMTSGDSGLYCTTRARSSGAATLCATFFGLQGAKARRIQFGSTDADGILFVPPERSLIVTQYKEGVEPVK